MTLFSLAWIDRGAHTTPMHVSKVDLAFSSIFMVFVVLCLAFQFYRIRNFIAT